MTVRPVSAGTVALIVLGRDAASVEIDDLPEGWVRWDTGETHAVLTFRPEVFDSDAYPAPCLPTIYLTKGQRDRRPGRRRPDPSDPWYVTLSLEPDVTRDPETFAESEAAIQGANRLAAAFARGDVDYRSLYQVPRESYLDALDDLTGRD